MAIDNGLRNQLLTYQRNEITEYYLYRRLAVRIDDPHNRDIVERIAEDELKHYRTWKKYTQQDVEPSRYGLWKYYLLSRVFGLSFGTKIMERAEQEDQEHYEQLRDEIPEMDEILQDENDHEDHLVSLFDQERRQYAGSIVLGLNDALVELLGALAGLTLALQDTRLIALSALTTGIAAAMSMAASEYLSSKAEDTDKHPPTASAYTGITYFGTVLILVFPYIIFENYHVCLGISFVAALVLITVFNYYLAVTQEVSFRRRFLEMAGLSFGVAAISFGVGYTLRALFGINAG